MCITRWDAAEELWDAHLERTLDSSCSEEWHRERRQYTDTLYGKGCGHAHAGKGYAHGIGRDDCSS